VAWTSDASGRWAQRWVEWDGFARFWAQAVRWTVAERTDVGVEVVVALEGETAHVTADAVDESGGFIDGLDAGVSVVGPAGGATWVELAQTAPGRYEGTFVPPAEGAYLMRLAGTLAGREAVARTAGWVMGYSPEYAALGGDPAYLATLAELGGGAVLEEPAGALAHDLKGAGVRQDLWPYLLGLAALLLPIDVGVRRLALSRRDVVRAWGWLVAHLGRHWPRPAAETRSAVGRLFQAKARAEERRAVGPVSAADAPAPSAEPEARVAPAEPPTAPPSSSAPAATESEVETLAGRLLERRREREEDG
jgi:hypothetical protein